LRQVLPRPPAARLRRVISNSDGGNAAEDESRDEGVVLRRLRFLCTWKRYCNTHTLFKPPVFLLLASEAYVIEYPRRDSRVMNCGKRQCVPGRSCSSAWLSQMWLAAVEVASLPDTSPQMALSTGIMCSSMGCTSQMADILGHHRFKAMDSSSREMRDSCTTGASGRT
jgi:hypothetical protein